MQTDLLTTKEAAEHIGIKPGTLCNWRSQGRGPKFVKMGSAVRYRRASLDRYINQSEQQQTSVA